MAKTILHKYVREELARTQSNTKILMEMSGEVVKTNKVIKLTVGEDEVNLNQRLLNSLSKKIPGRLPGLFKLSNTNMSLPYNPIILNKDTLAFFNDAKSEFNQVAKKMPLFFQKGWADQKTVDSAWYAYVSKMELYKEAKINEKVKDNGDVKYNKQFVAPDARMKKYLKSPLDSLIKAIIKTKYDSSKINFKGDDETVESLQDFQIFNYNRIKKKLVKNKLSPAESKLLAKPNDKELFKTYEKELYKAMIESELNGSVMPPNIYLEVAVVVLKDMGEYTTKQVHGLKVDDKGKILALRAGMDYERAVMVEFKKS